LVLLDSNPTTPPIETSTEYDTIGATKLLGPVIHILFAHNLKCRCDISGSREAISTDVLDDKLLVLTSA
jgi:hypothetical protein